MNMKKFHPLEDWLDTLPEPRTLEEKLVCWWSDFIDRCLIFKMMTRIRHESTVPIVTDDGHMCCDACGCEIVKRQKHCAKCKRFIDWNK
jgi:hypothetical protein